jgi:hypothetical protein
MIDDASMFIYVIKIYAGLLSPLSIWYGSHMFKTLKNISGSLQFYQQAMRISDFRYINDALI